MVKYIKLSSYERRQWHLWYAWFPVTVHAYPDGAKKKVWLKTVLRCEAPYETCVRGDFSGHIFSDISYFYKYKER